MTIQRHISSYMLGGMQRLVPRSALGLVYHTLSWTARPHVKHLFDHKTPGMFLDDLAYLKERDWVVAHQDLIGIPADSKPLFQRPSISISFDDGHAECYSQARPLLNEMGISCAFFVPSCVIDNGAMLMMHRASLCAEALGEMAPDEAEPVLRKIGSCLGAPMLRAADFHSWINSLPWASEATMDEVCGLLDVDCSEYLESSRPYMTSEQLLQLVDDGHTVGAHTIDHPPLWRLSEEEVEQQIVESCRRICDLTGRRSVPFAFPYSSRGLSRSFLDRLLRDYDCIEWYYDGGGLAEEVPGTLQRVAADQPGSAQTSLGPDNEAPASGADADRSNVPHILKELYLRHFRVDVRQHLRDMAVGWLKPFLSESAP